MGGGHQILTLLLAALGPVSVPGRTSADLNPSLLPLPTANPESYRKSNRSCRLQQIFGKQLEQQQQPKGGKKERKKDSISMNQK